MELQSNDEGGIGIVIGLDQAIVGPCHGLELRRKIANTLVMVAVHLDLFASVPASQGSAGHDGDGMPVSVVVVVIDVRPLRALFRLYVSVESSAAGYVKQLRTTADPQNRHLAVQGLAQKSQFNRILEGMRGFYIVDVSLAGGVTRGVDVLSFHKQKTVHLFHILTQTTRRALHDGHDDREQAEADKEFKMQFTNVVDQPAFPRRATGDDEDRGPLHCRHVRKAATRRTSFSRPCEATRI